MIGPATTGPLSATDIENLAVLGRVWGFVKYHHPTVSSGTVDWDAELILAMPAVLDAADASERNAAILSWLEDDLGAPPPCTICASAPADPYFLPEIDWIHDKGLLGDSLSTYLEGVYDNRVLGASQRYVTESSQGAPNPIFTNESSYTQMSLPDGGFRLLALFRLWNIIEYWFPYRDLIGEPWEDVLSEFVPVLYNASTRDEYRLALLQVFARINDTHANLWNGFYGVQPPVGDCQLPVSVRFIEGSPTIVRYIDPVSGPATQLQIGDVIVEMDAQAPVDLVTDWSPYYPASNEPTRLRDIARNFSRGPCGTVDLRVQRGASLVDVTATREPLNQLDLSGEWVHDRPGNTFQMLAPDIAYLKLSSVLVADTTQYVTDAQGTLGMVIDIRNYPNEFVVFALGDHLVTTPEPFSRFTVADLGNPGAFNWGPLIITHQPALPYYNGRVAILIDETTQSQAEYTTMAFRVAPDAAVIGSTTAGADGNVSTIPLPGDMSGLMSGLGNFYPDKSPTQRIGIIPDIVVSPTLAGITQGRDEVLDRAIQWMRGTSAGDVDGDGVPDNSDAFPYDPALSVGTAGTLALAKSTQSLSTAMNGSMDITDAATDRSSDRASTAASGGIVKIGDVNGDRRAEFVVVHRESSTNRQELLLIDGATGTVLRTRTLAAEPSSTVLALADITGDLIDDAAILLDAGPSASVEDATNGIHVADIPFDPALSPDALLATGDLDGDGNAELTLLGETDTAAVFAESRSVSDGALISRVGFDANDSIIDAAVLDDIGGSPAREIALLGVSRTGLVSVQIKDALSGALIGRAPFAADATPVALAALPDASGAASLLGVIARDARGVLKAEIKRARDGASVGDLEFDGFREPLALFGFADPNGAGMGRVGLLGTDAEGLIRAEIREIASGAPVASFAFDSDYDFLDAIAIDGGAGRSPGEIVVLGADSAGGLRIEARDALTGARVSSATIAQ